MFIIGILLLGTFGGVLGAIQAPVNGSLGKHVGPLQATWVSMTGSFLIMILVNVVYHVAAGAPFGLLRLGECEPWMLLGGLEGCVVLFGFAACTPRLGVALTSTLAMLGQMATCLVIDAFGFLGTTPLPTNFFRIAGIALFVVGVMLVYHGNTQQERVMNSHVLAARCRVQAQEAHSNVGSAAAHNHALTDTRMMGKQTAENDMHRTDGTRTAGKSAAPFVVLIIVSGMATGFQLPTNVALQSHVGIPEALLFHFGLGSLIMFFVVLFTQKGHFHSFKGVAPWKMSGGVYGVFGVPIMMIVTAAVGTALNSALIALGQLAGALVVDGFGLLQTQKRLISIWRVMGVVVLVASIALVTVGRL